MRGGSPVIAHYGSVATEVALCVKRAGIVERPELCVLELAGQAPFLEHVLDRALGKLAPAPGPCGRGRRDVVRPPHGQSRPRGGPRGRSGALARARAPLHARGHAADVPRAAGDGRRLARRAARRGRARRPPACPATCRPAARAAALLGTAPAVVVRERADGFLVFAEAAPGRDPWDALCEAGRPLGLAPVGHDALDRLTAALHLAPAHRTLL